jgi:lysophospholipase L1-like esterase
VHALGRSSSLRTRVATAALVVASTLVGLALLELGLRLAHVPVGTVQINRATLRKSRDEGLLFELVPGARVRAEVDYRVNSLGLRNPEVELAKPPGVRRLAVLGDSITFGYWVAEEQAYPRQLERLLAARGDKPRVEVLNFGVPGYNLDQELQVLRIKAAAFQPDAVLVGFCLNDLEGLFSYEFGLLQDRSAQRSSLAGRAWDTLLGHSLFFAWLEYRRNELEARRTFVRDKNPWRESLDPVAFERQRAALDQRFARLATELRGLGGIPGAVAIFPTFGKRLDKYPYTRLHALIAESAAGAGLLPIDLLPCFSGYDLHDVRVDVVHPSPLGHRVAAHAIADGLCAGRVLCAGEWRAAGMGTCGDYRPADFPSVRGY